MPKTPKAQRDKMKETNIKYRKLALRKPTQTFSLDAQHFSMS